MLSTHQAQEVLDVRGCIGKNPSPTSAKDLCEGQLSPLELVFGVELGLNSHSKNLTYTLAFSITFDKLEVIIKLQILQLYTAFLHLR